MLQFIPATLITAIEQLQQTHFWGSGPDITICSDRIQKKLDFNEKPNNLSIGNALSKKSELRSEVVNTEISLVCNTCNSKIDNFLS